MITKLNLIGVALIALVPSTAAQAEVEADVGLSGSLNAAGQHAFRAYNPGNIYVSNVGNGLAGPPASYSGHGDTGVYDNTLSVLSSTGSKDKTGNLAAASNALSGTDIYGGTASAYAAADLRKGQLHASASGNFEYVYGGEDQFTQGYARVGILDTLTFNVAGATANTKSDITLNYTLDGSQTLNSALRQGGARAEVGWQVFFGNNGATSVNQASLWTPGSAGAHYGPPGDPSGPYPVYDALGQGAGYYSNITLLGVNIISDTPEDTRLQFNYQLTGASTTAGFADGLALNCSDGVSCNYHDTSTVGFTLPTGVTLSSASGQFLTGGASGAPEPASWALMLAGFGAVGFAARRRGLTRVTA